MSIELKDIELIDRYLSGSLDAASKEAFTTRLQSDASLQQLLSDVKSTNELVKANEFAKVQVQLDSFSYDAAPWWQSNVTKYLAVAGVAAVVTTAVWLSSSDDKPVPVKENKTVVQPSSPKGQQFSVVQPEEVQSATNTKPKTKEQSAPVKEDQNWIAPSIVPDVFVPQENSVPVLSSTPTGPAGVPPQQDPVVSSPSTVKTKVDSSNTPPVLLTPEVPVKKDFYVQLPNQYWVYPDYMKNGNLHIVNESGAVINDLTLNGSNESWNGADRYGNTVPSGLYFYKFTDADSGKIYTGSITVVY